MISKGSIVEKRLNKGTVMFLFILNLKGLLLAQTKIACIGMYLTTSERWRKSLSL